MKVAWSIYAAIQVVIIVLCLSNTFDANTAQAVAAVLSISSGGYLVWLCVSTGRHSYTNILRRYLVATIVGLIVLAPSVWVSVRDIDAPFIWMRAHPHLGNLLFMGFMQVLPFTAVMIVLTLSVVGSMLPWFQRKPKPKEDQEPITDASDPENGRWVLLLMRSRVLLGAIVICIALCVGIIVVSERLLNMSGNPMYLFIIGVLVVFGIFLSRFQWLAELALDNGRLQIITQDRSLLDVPLESLEYVNIRWFKPAPWGALLHVKSQTGSKHFWLIISPGQDFPGYERFTLDKLKKDVSGLEQYFADEHLPVRTRVSDTIIANIPIAFIVFVFVAVIVGPILAFTVFW